MSSVYIRESVPVHAGEVKRRSGTGRNGDSGGCEVCLRTVTERRRFDRGLSGPGCRTTLTREAISDRSPGNRAGRRAAVNNDVEVVLTEPRAVAEAAMEVIS